MVKSTGGLLGGLGRLFGCLGCVVGGLRPAWAGNHKIDLYWSNNSESSIDPITQDLDFEGYRIYLSKLGFDVEGTQNLSSDFIRATEFDLIGNGIFYETRREFGKGSKKEMAKTK